jgi:H+-translocating NAD(P) transhydrogenase subunit alpha
VLAIFVGFEVITKVPPTLHTPLMSGSNAISGITLVGAVVVAGSGGAVFATVWAPSPWRWRRSTSSAVSW